ncbi:GMC family oxidoreductase [Ruegeria sediminis]|uniref:GMC family oxidoreductase n=1 Tax=Ruegeria sediminis TaxID=2583820 RepID=A0ABY2WWB2_9RHOB|nr:FAD-dependent oxidoreductase [Ruegeria sediminis]TMV07044.1 GMC family oxidoreductase [Ruegeria sediminis]
MTDVVIGSGPSGVSVATALLRRGRQVLMLDGGRTLGPETQDRKGRMAASDPSEWSAEDLGDWQAPQFDSPPGQVRRYGSDFAMEPGQETFVRPQGIGLRASHATGGLSNLWGAAVLPNRAADMADWPIGIDELAPHYQAVAEFLPVSGRTDDLQDVFPAFPMQGLSALSHSPQAGRILDRLNRSKADLADMGVRSGASRLAVNPGCRYCGQCLHGCPWGLIYSATQSLDNLFRHAGFQHRTGLVRRFEEAGSHVALTLADGEILRAGRVFVATGVLETARLLLASHPDQSRKLRLQDSQHLFLPSLHRWRVSPRPDQRPYHTLPQIFVEVDDPQISPYLVHSQIYTWNEFYAHDLITRYGAKLPGSAPLWNMLARRLIVAQVFLHSAHSPQIELSLAPDGRLSPSVLPNSATHGVMKAASSRLAQVLNKAGCTALTFASRPGEPGSSFHTGGSVPMSRNPVPGQADTLGRPRGLERVHIVDASCLPSIPATTITFTVIANAHRIGSLAPED